MGDPLTNRLTMDVRRLGGPGEGTSGPIRPGLKGATGGSDNTCVLSPCVGLHVVKQKVQ